MSHRIEQRFRVKIFKQARAFFQREHLEDRQEFDNKQKKIKSRIRQDVKEKYGFEPDSSLSVFENAAVVIGNTIAWHYHSRPSNLVFHKLTKGKVVPPIMRALLGLSRCFKALNSVFTSYLLNNDYWSG